MLQDFIRTHRATIIDRTRARLAKRTAPRATPEELENGVPLFLEEFVALLEGTDANEPVGVTAAEHGVDLLRLGFSVAQVVQDYGDICQALTDLAIEHQTPISTEEFRSLNLALDEATAHAVGAYGRRRDEKVAAGQTEKMGAFAHELRNLLSSATLAHEMIRHGDVPAAGKTAAVLTRSLAGMRNLVDRSLVEVRLDAGLQPHQPVPVATFVEDVTIVAAILARERGVTFSVGATDPDVVVEGDRQILAGVLTNLLQNAFKFTKRDGHVALTTRVFADRVEIDVADECGGLPDHFCETAFKPFSQRGDDRSGLGLGLSIARRGAEAHGGALRVKDLPGRGCVFTVELPAHTREANK